MTAVRVLAGLSGGSNVDVSSSVVSVSVQRGRQDETEPFQGGRASLVLRNVAGTFDPAGTAVFRLRDDVEVAWVGGGTAVPVFTGFVEDVTLDYDLSGDAIVNVACVDGLALLANQTLVPQSVGGAVWGPGYGGARERRGVVARRNRYRHGHLRVGRRDGYRERVGVFPAGGGVGAGLPVCGP
jgi:hypothetical protein